MGKRVCRITQKLTRKARNSGARSYVKPLARSPGRGYTRPQVGRLGTVPEPYKPKMGDRLRWRAGALGGQCPGGYLDPLACRGFRVARLGARHTESPPRRRRLPRWRRRSSRAGRRGRSGVGCFPARHQAALSSSRDRHPNVSSEAIPRRLQGRNRIEPALWLRSSWERANGLRRCAPGTDSHPERRRRAGRSPGLGRPAPPAGAPRPSGRGPGARSWER